MQEPLITPGPASIKPVLLVAGMLLAAIVGAAVTIHPARSPGHQVPTPGVVVVRGPSTASHHSDVRAHSESAGAPQWV